MYQMLSIIALLVLLSPAAAWKGFEADTGASVKQTAPYAMAKRMLLQQLLPACNKTANVQSCISRGAHPRTGTCINNLGITCAAGWTHTVVQAGGTTPASEWWFAPCLSCENVNVRAAAQ
jgi:hypothetical protein